MPIIDYEQLNDNIQYKFIILNFCCFDCMKLEKLKITYNWKSNLPFCWYNSKYYNIILVELNNKFYEVINRKENYYGITTKANLEIQQN